MKQPAGLRAAVRGGKGRGGEQGQELKPDKNAQLVTTLCEMFGEEKQVDRPTLLRLIKLAGENLESVAAREFFLKTTHTGPHILTEAKGGYI